MKTKNLPIYALIPWILLLGVKLISLARACSSLVTLITNAFTHPAVHALDAVFSAASILLFLCNIAATAGVIVALFRKKCGKLMIVSLALPVASILLSSLLSFLRIFLQNNPISAVLSLFNWIATPLDVLTYLLLILFTFGALFPKNKFLRFCATKLFFLPCLLSVGSCILSTISAVSNMVALFATYHTAGIALSFSLLISPVCSLLLTCTTNLLFLISLLTLGLFIRKSAKRHFEQLTCPIDSAEGL